MPHNATELEMAQNDTAKYCHFVADTDIWRESFQMFSAFRFFTYLLYMFVVI